MSQGYDRLITRESLHWGNVRPDPENPQIWDNPTLYQIFFLKEHLLLVERAVANGPKVLELGCGEGDLAIELANKGLDVTAIDLSPERIQRAIEKAKDLSNAPKFQVGDLNTGSFPSSTFDCVVANGSLHHILALDHLLEEVRKTLKPAGKLVVFDFIGMGTLRKLFAALLYAVLPTYKPYSAKWKLRSRITAFLSTEKKKRRAIENQETSALHPDSPFEEISGASIIEETRNRFKILETFTFLPFWYYLAPKIKLPQSLRYPTARFLRRTDDLLVQFHLAKGTYVFIEAQKT
ncbi:MAG: class I SAM-dependent methyltransferase [Bacteroidota bacterium]